MVTNMMDLIGSHCDGKISFTADEINHKNLDSTIIID